MNRRIAVVTGASSGVGDAVVDRFLARDIDVIGVDVATAPERGSGARFVPVEGSVSETAVWEKVRATARDSFGTDPEIVVFNAAIMEVGTILDLTEDAWQRSYDVNVNGVFRGLRVLLPSMIAAGVGSIVTVASVDAYMVEQGAAAYCSSKGALLQLTKSIAIDYARNGIRANCIAPGVIDTPFFRRHLHTAADPEKFLEVRRQRNPLGRFLDASEVARSVEFAAIDASGMTGSVLTVDAGLSASFDFRTAGNGA